MYKCHFGTFFIMMMNLILFILYAFSFPFFCYAKKGKDSSIFLPLGLLASIVILYIFFLLQKIEFAFYILCIMAIAFWGWGIAFLVKRKKSLLAFFTPAILAYAITCIVIYFLTQNSIVSLWDELRLWGAVPRYLYYNGISHLGPESIIYTDMQNYPPAMALFQYLLLKLGSSYEDNILFFAYAVLGASFFVPAIQAKKKSYFLLPFYVVTIVFLPQAYSNSYEFDSNFYYTTLFIDPLIGILLGSLFSQLLQNPFEKSRLWLFALSLFTLTLLKEAGLYYALPILLFALLLYGKEILKNKNLLAILAIIFPLFAYFSYHFALQNAGVYEPSGVGLQSLFNVLQNPSEEQTMVLDAYFRLIYEKIMVIQGNLFSLFGLGDFVTPFIALIANLALALLCLLFVEKEQRKKLLAVSIFALVFVVLFFYSLLPVYLLRIGHNELEFPSFQRYLSTALLAQMLFPIFAIMHYSSAGKSKKSFVAYLSALILCFLVFPLGQPKDTGYGWAREAAMPAYQSIKEGVGDRNKKVYVIMNNSEGEDILLHHQLFYLLIADGINVDNTMKDIDWLNYIAPEELAEQLQNYDYLYLYADYEDVFAEHYAHLFTGDVLEGTLYRIQKTEDGIQLEALQ